MRASTLTLLLVAGMTPNGPVEAAPPDGAVLKRVLGPSEATGPNLLKAEAWRPFEKGFTREGDAFVCDNATDATARRGAAQTVVLNQTRPEPIVAAATSRAEGVTGSADNDYALYIDLVYADGTSLWGQAAPFRTGTHGDQEVRVVIVPERPVRQLTVNLLLRSHGGKAVFTNPSLRVVSAPGESVLFDGLPVLANGPAIEGFQVRDVAAGGPFVRIDREAAGLVLEAKERPAGAATYTEVEVRDTTGRDRALTLVYAVPVPAANLRWCDDPRRTVSVEPGREYARTVRYRAGSNGRLSLYPVGAVAAPDRGVALGTDPTTPAFCRLAYNAGTGELYLAYDLALTPEKPSARLRFVRYGFDPAWGFRSAWGAYMGLYPEAFLVRVAKQGVWMPFAAISKVKDHEDFGFAFKEGHDETAWDDAHGVLTFRYTEPLTWWMSMPRGMPRTMDAARAEARCLADAGRREARAWLNSGYHDADGQPAARLLDTPWSDGAVWSMNSMPALSGEITDFKNKWNPALREKLYGPARKGDLDGEYVDSSEGYVTDELDYRRDHFAAADTPLVYDPDTHRPAIFRGLIAFEYVRALERDVHAMNKYMMANSTPARLPWLAPLLDVLGTETDWNPGGHWRPMSDADLLYRRALCGAKPFCFLMNTDFDRFGPDRVERYMKRSLAFGMFPGFFSPNASGGHYFSRPELYDRDRPLFRRYVPLCRLVAEAGWQPVTGARSSDEKVLLERFGGHQPGQPAYLTAFNDSPERQSVTITLEGSPTPTTPGRELVREEPVRWEAGSTTLTLEPEDVAVLELPR